MVARRHRFTDVRGLSHSVHRRAHGPTRRRAGAWVRGRRCRRRCSPRDPSPFRLWRGVLRRRAPLRQTTAFAAYECSAPAVLPHTTRFLCGSRLTRVMQRCAPPRALPAVRLHPLSPSRCSLSSAHDTDERERGLIDVEHFVLRVCAPGRPGGLARGPTREECTRHRYASSTRRRGRPRYVQSKSLPNVVLQRSDGGVIAPYAPLFPFRTHPGAGSSVRTDAVQHNHSSVMASKSRARRGSLSSPVSATSPKGTAPQVTPKLVDSSL